MNSYEDALRSEASNRQIARDWGKSETSVRRARKRLGVLSPFPPNEQRSKAAPAPVVTSGESETHNPDGSSSYVRFSERPWGYDDYREFIRSQGQDPDQVTFTWGWTSNPAGGFWNKLNNVRPVSEGDSGVYPLSHFYDHVENEAVHIETTPSFASSGRGLVVCLADWQLGKVGRRGGTAETLKRLLDTQARLLDIYDEGGYEEVLIFDLGDGIEGFESGGNPMFSNDLSLPDQLDAYSTELFKFIDDAYGYAKVKVAAVPSNHAAWRNGKQSLGKPTDDFGLYVHKEVRKVSEAHGYEIEWFVPEDYDESVAVNVLGTTVGGVHGNQFAPGRAIEWWQGQAFGSQAVTKADVMVTGHYHTFGAGVAGINPFSGRERMWLGAPTVDNGSDWYRNLKGRDSLPGTLIFEVGEDGFDLGSMRII